MKNAKKVLVVYPWSYFRIFIPICTSLDLSSNLSSVSLSYQMTHNLYLTGKLE